MEEIIGQIKLAEAKAEKIIKEAEDDAAKLSSKTTADCDALYVEYEKKLRHDALSIMSEAKSKSDELHEREISAANQRADEIKKIALQKVDDCVNYVFECINREIL